MRTGDERHRHRRPHHRRGSGADESQEFLVWLKYREVRTAQYHDAYRVGASLVASVSANINKAKNTPPFKVSDFAPHINEAPLSLEEAMKSWQ